jgi:hypothetical protein
MRHERRLGYETEGLPPQQTSLVWFGLPIEPWNVMKKALPQCGGDTSSCSDPYPMAACPQCLISCWLDRELFTLLSYIDYHSGPSNSKYFIDPVFLLY